MNKVLNHTLFTEYDVYLFRTGKHYKLYEKFGAHLIDVDGDSGIYFSVYAPTATRVSIIGEFNHWKPENYDLHVRWDESGIWEGFISGIGKGELYKFKIESNNHDQILEKADPFSVYCEIPPQTASIVWDLEYQWKDKKWNKTRLKKNALDQPFSVYEVHLGSWKKITEENRSLTYLEHAELLCAYIVEMGYTHVEFLPIMEHPYDPSWGYQVTGFFAPTSRFGSPQDFMLLVDQMHQNNIAVILDWVPAHFPSDAYGLANFDGSNLYDHPDPKKGYHPDWKSMIFNYERNEIRSFLLSSAIFWIEKYHIDGLRVDAVASMIYLDYSRNEGEWEPNELGGNENLAAITLLKQVNEILYENYPGTQTIAEESTAFPKISHPTSEGGLGFGMKWMMGWMHDSLNYFKLDPIYRKFHHNQITFSIIYAFTENFMLPLSHDEVVHGKGSILTKMPGDEWQKFANVRALYSYMFTHPGGKLLFMGNDFAQRREWNFKESLDWHLLELESHKGISNLVKKLNRLYVKEPALHVNDFNEKGFEWIDYSNADQSILIYCRKSDIEEETILVICNLTPEPKDHYEVGAPLEGTWKLLLNSDDKLFWGSGYGAKKTAKTLDKKLHNQKQSIDLKLPPLAVLIYKLKGISNSKKT